MHGPQIRFVAKESLAWSAKGEKREESFEDEGGLGAKNVSNLPRMSSLQTIFFSTRTSQLTAKRKEDVGAKKNERKKTRITNTTQTNNNKTTRQITKTTSVTIIWLFPTAMTKARQYELRSDPIWPLLIGVRPWDSVFIQWKWGSRGVSGSHGIVGRRHNEMIKYEMHTRRARKNERKK